MSSNTIPAAPAAFPEETHDLHGFTAPWNLPGQAESRASKRALDAWLDTLTEKPAWSRRYEELIEERTDDNKARWDWRKALFIAWSALPASLQVPKTITELADLLCVNPATIRHWRADDPEIDRRVQQVKVRLVDDRVSDLLAASLDCALNSGEKGFQDRQMLLKLANVVKDKSTQEIVGPGGGPVQYRPVAELSDEELARIATGSG